MKLTSKQIKEIENALERGDKKVLAYELGIMPQALSRHFTTKKMPRAMYSKVLMFISKIEI